MNDYADKVRALTNARRQYIEELEDRAGDLKSTVTELAIDARYYSEDARLEMEELLAKAYAQLAAFERVFRQ